MPNNNSAYIYSKENGLETWIRKSDGERVVSVLGLSQMVDVSYPAVLHLLTYIEKGSVWFDPSNSLKPFLGKPLAPTDLVQFLSKNGKQTRVVSSDVAAAVITHYASMND